MCGQQYVGETGQPLHCRINSHRYMYNVVHQKSNESPVAEHFNDGAHSQAGMVVMVIDLVYSHDSSMLKIRERRWLRTLGTSFHLGMNLGVDSL